MKCSRPFLVLLLVLAYAGQSMAALTAPCRQMADAASAQSAVPAMAHAGHVMPAQDTSKPAAPMADCCGGGLCAMSHCQSAPAVPLDHTDSGRQYAALYFPVEDITSPTHPVESPYRPPISR